MYRRSGFFIGKSRKELMLVGCVLFDEEDPHPGEDVMLACAPGSKELVDRLYQKVIALGATGMVRRVCVLRFLFDSACIRDSDGNEVFFEDRG